jgi:hypothetical protein
MSVYIKVYRTVYLGNIFFRRIAYIQELKDITLKVATLTDSIMFPSHLYTLYKTTKQSAITLAKHRRSLF